MFSLIDKLDISISVDAGTCLANLGGWFESLWVCYQAFGKGYNSNYSSWVNHWALFEKLGDNT